MSANAAVREVYEETGVHIAVERLAGVALREVTYSHGDVCQYLTVWFRCKAIGGHAVVKDEESSAVGWYSPEGFPDLDAVDRLRINTALDDAADMVRRTWTYARLAPGSILIPASDGVQPEWASAHRQIRAFRLALSPKCRGSFRRARCRHEHALRVRARSERRR